MSPFKTKSVEEAFLRWATLWGGNPQQTHPKDNEVFYDFAMALFRNEDILLLDKNDFVRFAKKYIPTSSTHNRGLTQRYYDKLVIINDFMKSATRKELVILNQ